MQKQFPPLLVTFPIQTLYVRIFEISISKKDAEADLVHQQRETSLFLCCLVCNFTSLSVCPLYI